MLPLGAVPSTSTADEIFAAEREAAEGRARANPEGAYWAAREPEAVIAELEKKERGFFDFQRRRGFVSMWKIMFAQWLGLDPEGMGDWATQTVSLDGDRGELVRFRVNETRSFVKQLITLALGQRPAFECMALNTDYNSLGQVETADNIIEYAYWEKYGERKERKTVTRGALFGLSWAWVNWDVWAGEWIEKEEPVTQQLPDGTTAPKMDARTGKPVMRKVKTGERAGELTLKSLYPWEVFFEPRVEEFDEHIWRCVRERRSRWEVAAAFPEQRAAILDRGKRDQYGLEALFGIDGGGLTASDDDEVIVYHFYHAPSDAFEAPNPNDPEAKDFRQGRYLAYCNGKPLRDVVLPYNKIPLEDFCPSEFFGTAFGYADSWDLCSINQMLDQMVSNVATNLTTFSVQSIVVEEGTDFSTDAIANGANVFTVRQGAKPPEALQLASIPESAKWFLEYLQARFQSLTALNSVARGDPSSNISSGTMAALFHSIAIEANSALQAAVDSHRERVANLVLDVMRRYANHPQVMQIAGIDERPYIETFTRDAFSDVRGVRVRTANPMMRSTAGRMQMAELMLKIPGIITEPAQVTEVIVSGQLKPAYDSPRKKRLRIKYENETLANGPPTQQVTPPPMPAFPDGVQPPPPPPYEVVPAVPVFAFDDHRQHIHEHCSLLASRDALMNEPLRKAVETHIAHHMREWREGDQMAFHALGLPVFMPPPGAMPPGGALPPEAPPPPNGKPAGKAPVDVPGGAEAENVPLPRPAQPPAPPKRNAA